MKSTYLFFLGGAGAFVCRVGFVGRCVSSIFFFVPRVFRKDKCACSPDRLASPHTRPVPPLLLLLLRGPLRDAPPTPALPQALAVLPTSGNPHNQLAVLATYTDAECVSVYRYCRSLMIASPFQTAHENLTLLFEKNKQKGFAMPPPPADGAKEGGGGRDSTGAPSGGGGGHHHGKGKGKGSGG